MVDLGSQWFADWLIENERAVKIWEVSVIFVLPTAFQGIPSVI